MKTFTNLGAKDRHFVAEK